ncbi:hypothetical protein J5N97_017828 [Dioscorea zingiberensis]|uniref:Uncharacterized protein n=1 Tax=Dioscorea zingiberensis TaxID=325984 RepID=A0A9D5CNY8_9LILI|nr:hypothetical protein J5N97_017828 [Dioscorea zingiberensis]
MQSVKELLIIYEAFLQTGDPDFAWKPPKDEWQSIAFVTPKQSLNSAREAALSEDTMKFGCTKLPCYWVPKSVIFGLLRKTVMGKQQVMPKPVLTLLSFSFPLSCSDIGVDDLENEFILNNHSQLGNGCAGVFTMVLWSVSPKLIWRVDGMKGTQQIERNSDIGWHGFLELLKNPKSQLLLFCITASSRVLSSFLGASTPATISAYELPSHLGLAQFGAWSVEASADVFFPVFFSAAVPETMGRHLSHLPGDSLFTF